ncbi:MAG: hypothetical protein PHS53_04220 [Candidatus Pacebacteria bacterium]|nr:hypothetical protein [Candidatus Paceibacterota bacterium]MDD5357324.1 hypothetical protein [Candidatus Paceibacterota bacterium]
MLEINPKNLHHAYCIVGEREEVTSELLEFFERQLKVKTIGNPDFWRGEFDSLSIDDARQIAEIQSKKAYGIGNKKIFLILANKITREAQNALLKVLEEPTLDTHFFLVISSTEGLLSTLKSRLFIINTNGENKWEADAKEFLSSAKPKRLTSVKKMTDEISDEKKTKADAISFLNAVEAVLKEKVGTLKSKEDAKAFEELIKFRSYLGDQAPSVKMILEHLALILPVVK